jgi:mRNA interferase RelE/StbE
MARRGTYRVLYRIDDHAHIVTVVLVTHRRDALPPPVIFG